ncbi:TolC family protein, partial [Pseudomonas aeruginosa]|uniref:TolC family protein n=1 Tax=Pseudomonas aeruginosa TaxID=287 RepID=UPI0035A8B402
ETLNQVRKMFNQSSSSAAKIRAYEMTVESARTLVMATRKSIAAGVRVNLDLLNAEQALYSAMNELSKAKYDYLTAWARLRFYAGVLDEADLELVAANFRDHSRTKEI